MKNQINKYHLEYDMNLRFLIFDHWHYVNESQMKIMN
jgi:hypothetical protein